MSKAPTAFRTISEVSEELNVPKHVLRFWEMKFPQIKPMKRGGGRRYYRPEDLDLLKGICHLLHAEAYTIKGVQKILRERGVDSVKEMGEQAVAKKKRAAKAAATRSSRASKQPARKIEAKAPPAKARKTAAAKGTGARAGKNSKAVAVAGGEFDEAIVDALNRAISELQACRRALLGTPDAKRSQARSAGQARG